MPTKSTSRYHGMESVIAWLEGVFFSRSPFLFSSGSVVGVEALTVSDPSEEESRWSPSASCARVDELLTGLSVMSLLSPEAVGIIIGTGPETAGLVLFIV